MREFLQILMEGEGHEVELAATYAQAQQCCRDAQFDLVITDLKLPDGSGLDVLKAVKESQVDAQTIMLTAFATTETAVEAMRLGAYDYQIKPVKVDELSALSTKALEKVQLVRENRELSLELNQRITTDRILGQSSATRALIKMIAKIAPTKSNVLIEGESGTGKELVSRAVHDASTRKTGPFIAINCGAIPESLIEAELFGHVAGAYTGASKARDGLFEAANGGTLLLDEIGELPLSMQVKLLRVLQERRVRRVGDDKERDVDIRLIASTNRDLEEMVGEGAFREDLFYRLNVVRLRVAPLRERAEDIPMLARGFVAKYATDAEKQISGIAPDAMATLCCYPFPGNVRELENSIERAVALAAEEFIQREDLPEKILQKASDPSGDPLEFMEEGVNLEGRLQQIELSFIMEAMRRTGGVKKRAAELLGLSFRSFRYRLQKLNMGEDSENDESD
ncbi:MAG: sigma-54-dependent Fis family transcriptional regulator [Deltaproteobacteria bacterium]|nr:sigma-54-dependent Fis family transcriptional regulator [Deltaproteobacteria bacterium]MBT6432559.1 sigma-54-dependent Fis family transcriptional regulator [Deltaproteobacteria bacterium]